MVNNNLICHKSCQIKERADFLTSQSLTHCNLSSFLAFAKITVLPISFTSLYLESDSSSFSLNCLPRLLLKPVDCSPCLWSCPFPIHQLQSCQLLSVSHQHQHYYLFCITLTGLCALLLHYTESFWMARTVFYLSLNLQHPALGLTHSKISISGYGKGAEKRRWDSNLSLYDFKA